MSHISVFVISQLSECRDRVEEEKFRRKDVDRHAFPKAFVGYPGICVFQQFHSLAGKYFLFVLPANAILQVKCHIKESLRRHASLDGLLVIQVKALVNECVDVVKHVVRITFLVKLQNKVYGESYPENSSRELYGSASADIGEQVVNQFFING